jgi:hypothetical protein
MLTYDDAVMLSQLRKAGHRIPKQLRIGMTPDVAKVVAAAHAQQRHAAAERSEPPKPYSEALKDRAQPQAHAPVLRDEHGTPMPWTQALQRRKEGR